MTVTTPGWRDAALLAELGEAFGLRAPRWGEALGGYSGENVALTANETSFVLKRVATASTDHLSRLERAALLLRRHHVPTPVPLATRAGGRFLRRADATYLLFARSPGAVRHGPTWAPRALEQAAATLAQVHSAQVGDAFTPGPRRRPLRDGPSTLPTPAELCQRWAPTGRKLACLPVLEASLASKRRLLAARAALAASSAEAVTQFVHGDFHNENLLFGANDAVTAVLDLEACYLGDGLDDVVSFVMLACGGQEAGAQGLLASRHFVAAYRSHLACTDGALVAAVARYFVTLASSTFLERRLLEGQTGAAALLARDGRRLDAFAANPTQFAAILFAPPPTEA